MAVVIPNLVARRSAGLPGPQLTRDHADRSRPVAINATELVLAIDGVDVPIRRPVQRSQAPNLPDHGMIEIVDQLPAAERQSDQLLE